MNFLKQFLTELVANGYSYIPPSSSGKDGYTIIGKGWLSNAAISKAESQAYKMVVSFKNDGDVYALPMDMIDSIRYEAFKDNLILCKQ